MCVVVCTSSPDARMRAPPPTVSIPQPPGIHADKHVFLRDARIQSTYSHCAHPQVLLTTRAKQKPPATATATATAATPPVAMADTAAKSRTATKAAASKPTPSDAAVKAAAPAPAPSQSATPAATPATTSKALPEARPPIEQLGLPVTTADARKATEQTKHPPAEAQPTKDKGDDERKRQQQQEQQELATTVALADVLARLSAEQTANGAKLDSLDESFARAVAVARRAVGAFDRTCTQLGRLHDEALHVVKTGVEHRNELFDAL
jgi:hypothetical protein